MTDLAKSKVAAWVVLPSNGQSPADTQMDAALTSFFEVPPPCVGVSGKHHARLIKECRCKSTTGSANGAHAVGKANSRPCLFMGTKRTCRSDRAMSGFGRRAEVPL